MSTHGHHGKGILSKDLLGRGAEPNSGNGADHASYSWTQTLSECLVSVPVPAGTKGRDCDVSLTTRRLRVGLKGQPPVLDGELSHPIKAEDSMWNMDGQAIEATLLKVNRLIKAGNIPDARPCQPLILARKIHTSVAKPSPQFMLLSTAKD